jgi:hypothetical protein
VAQTILPSIQLENSVAVHQLSSIHESKIVLLRMLLVIHSRMFSPRRAETSPADPFPRLMHASSSLPFPINSMMA